MKTRLTIVGAAAGLALAAAQACGPDFQIALTACGSSCLKQVRTAGLRAGLAPIIGAVATPVSEPEDGTITTAELEKQGLTPEQQAELASMRAAPSGDEAYKIGTDLAPAIRLYTAGAVDFLRVRSLMKGDGAEESSATQDSRHSSIEAGLSAAIARFSAAAALPENQAAGRVLWSEYMLGRAYRLRAKPDDLDSAETHLRRVVSMTQMGVDDPMSLANAALGELGRIALDRNQTSAALMLYAQQANSPGAQRSVDSVVRALHHVVNVDGGQLAAALGDPLLQRLIVAYGVSRVATTCDTDSCEGDAADHFAPRLLASLEALPPSKIVAGDQIAELAYAVGDYDFAARTVALSQSPLADWIRGKLALHRGALQEADAAFARAALHFQTEAPDPGVGQRFHAEWGVLKLARGEYVEALDQLLANSADFEQDIAYIAERVLTISELKRYVDTHPDCGRRLHSILATRLARADRVSEAVGYYPTDTAIPETYAREWGLAHDAPTKNERARAWYAVARMDIVNGMQLQGAQLAPDGGIWQGSFDVRESPSDLATKDEKARFEASAIMPDRRFHYRALGVTHLLHAVDELPKRSAVASAVLCQGAKLLRHHGEAPDGDLITKLYHRYQTSGQPAEWDRNFGTTCPEPQFDTGAVESPRPS